MKLSGATVLVTGGAVRIGRAICEALAKRGCEVVVHCNRSKCEARELVSRLEGRGVRAHTVSGNLATQAGCRRVMRDAVRKAGKLDILVNNASVFHPGTPKPGTGAQARDQVRVNLLAPMFLMREFAQRGLRGKIINMLDQRITRADADATPYQASKKALANLTLSAALDLAPRITVNGVAPGPVLAPVRSRCGGTEKAGRIPLGRRPAPEDVANAVVFLLENDAITGQIIFVDGGQHLTGVWE